MLYSESTSNESFNLEEQKLDLERKKFELEKERATFFDEQKRRGLELEKLKVEIASQSKNSSTERNSYITLYILKSFTSLILLIAGIWFTYVGNNLGPYMMGTAATTAGLDGAKLLKVGDKDKDPDKEGMTDK
jgi:hypothetical protein